MRARTAIVSLSAAAAIAAAPGCGEDTEQVSAQELVALGDEICAEGRRRFDEVQAEPPANAAAAADQAEALVAVATESLAELRAIEPPDELRGRYEAYLDARGRALRLLERGRDAARGKDADAYAAVQRKAAAESRERLRLARAVGFRVCSAERPRG